MHKAWQTLMLNLVEHCRNSWFRLGSQLTFMSVLSVVYAASFLVTLFRVITENGSPALIGALLATSLLSIALMLVRGPLNSHQPATFAVAPILGIISSVPLIPTFQAVNLCSSCTTTTYFGIAGCWLAVSIHLIALFSQVSGLRKAFAFAVILAKIALLGQVALLFADPKFCIFCVISSICMLPLATSIEGSETSYRTLPRFAASFFLLVGLLSVTSRAMFVQSNPEQPNSLLGSSIGSLIKGQLASDNVLVVAASWCHVCGELDARLKKSGVTLPIIWKCNQNQTAPSHLASCGFSVFPTFLRINNSGKVVEQYAGVPEIAELTQFIERSDSNE